jgi:hypothetical protein
MDRNDVAHPHHDRAGMLDRLLNDEVFRGANEYLEPVDYYRWAKRQRRRLKRSGDGRLRRRRAVSAFPIRWMWRHGLTWPSKPSRPEDGTKEVIGCKT